MDYYETIKNQAYNAEYYKKAPQCLIGGSDTCTAFAIGIDESDQWKMIPIHFGCDGVYHAYVCTDKAEIGSHYHLVGELFHHIRIIDEEDGGYTLQATADHIKIWRAGEFGCVIQLIGSPKIDERCVHLFTPSCFCTSEDRIW